MSNEHPNDNFQDRFSAFWIIVAVMLVFIVGLSLLFCWNRAAEKQAANVIEDSLAADRMKNLQKVRKDQQDLITQAGESKQAGLVRIPVKDGMKLVLPELQGKKAQVTKVVVPGSPTQLKEAAAAAAAAKKKKEAEGKKEGEAKPEEAGDKKEAKK